MSFDPAFEVVGLTKRFDSLAAVDAITFAARRLARPA